MDGTLIVAVVVLVVAAGIVVLVLTGQSTTSETALSMAQATADVEHVVGQKKDFVDGDMKEVVVLGTKILLVQDQNQVFAINPKCSHLGAPLKSGVVANGRVRCPWHGACFNLRTGDIEDHPCEKAIHSYTLQHDKGSDDLILKTTRQQLKERSREMARVDADAKNRACVLIVGAGAAGGMALEALRQYGFTGRIVVVGKEAYLPYDRTKLSKAMSIDVRKIEWRSKEFYTKLGVDMRLGVTVDNLDVKAKTASLSDGTSLTFDHAILATGGTPRSLPIPGMNLERVFQLRYPHEARGIHDATETADVVIIGSSFIGMEAAAVLVKRAASVTVIGMEKVPFERVLGEEVGTRLMKLHEDNGVVFHMERTVKAIHDNGNGSPKSVELDNGVVLRATTVVVGAGVVPTTDFVTGVEVARDQSLVSDEYLHVANGVYAAGDIVRFPYAPLDNELIRVEHYGYAQQQGRVAAANICGRKDKCDSIPFFWTAAYGKNLRYTGHGIGVDWICVDGDGLDFLAIYCKGEEVIAVAGMGRDQDVSAAAELMRGKKMPSKKEFSKRRSRGGFPNLMELLHA